MSSALVGPHVVRHLDASLEALRVQTPAEHLARIDQLVAPGPRG